MAIPINVRHQIWEAPPESAPLYDGIYTVTLTPPTSVTFVPSFDRQPGETIVLPENFDAIATPREARLIAVATSAYVVTPDDARAGTEESATWIDWSDTVPHSTPRVFYIGTDEFDSLATELDDLSEHFAGVHDTVPLASIAQTRLAALLRARVLPALDAHG